MPRDVRTLPPFALLIGSRLISLRPEEVVIEMEVGEEHLNRNGVLHGGAFLGLADNAGGTCASANLPEGRATTTIESKTNFLRPIRLGDTARATAAPLHVGATTMLIQVTITRGDGKVAALTTQTQMVMEWRD